MPRESTDTSRQDWLNEPCHRSTFWPYPSSGSQDRVPSRLPARRQARPPPAAVRSLAGGSQGAIRIHRHISAGLAERSTPLPVVLTVAVIRLAKQGAVTIAGATIAALARRQARPPPAAVRSLAGGGQGAIRIHRNIPARLAERPFPAAGIAAASRGRLADQLAIAIARAISFALGPWQGCPPPAAIRSLAFELSTTPAGLSICCGRNSGTNPPSGRRFGCQSQPTRRTGCRRDCRRDDRCTGATSGSSAASCRSQPGRRQSGCHSNPPKHPGTTGRTNHATARRSDRSRYSARKNRVPSRLPAR